VCDDISTTCSPPEQVSGVGELAFPLGAKRGGLRDRRPLARAPRAEAGLLTDVTPRPHVTATDQSGNMMRFL
jgi:hypothetical protein